MNFFKSVALVLFFSLGIASVVKEIKIIGNQNTKEYIILREIHHPIPGEYNPTFAQQDRDRIYNLGLFSTVKIVQIDSTYSVFIIETFPVFPLPIIEYNEASGFSYGVSIVHLNFRGMNEKLSLGGIIGKETTYFLSFINPWIWKDHVSLKGKLYQYQTKDPVYDYHYQENGFYIGTGFHKYKNHKYKLEIGAEVINLESIRDNFVLKKYEFLKSKLNYQYDTRDIYIDPASGHFFSISILPKYHIKNPELSYYRLFLQNTWYLTLSEKLNNLVLSFKSAVLFQQSESFPPFANVYLGGEDFVRGYSPNPKENKSIVAGLIEGYNILFQSVQLQHSLFEKADYGNIEMGMDLVYFVDMGIVSDMYYFFHTKDLIIGYGLGLRLFTSGIGTIRIDLGFNPYGGGHWHPSDGTGHHSDRMD